MIEEEIEEKRLYIKNHPTTYWTSHDVVDREYRNGVIDGLTAAAIHAKLDGASYGKYKGHEFARNGKINKPFIRTADDRIMKPHYERKANPKTQKIQPEELEKIREMYVSEGKSSTEIARVYGVSPSTIARLLNANGVVMSGSSRCRKILNQ